MLLAMSPARHLSIYHGAVEDLSRTTHITGGGETSARTTHIAMIKIAGKHCEYRSASPVPISEGETVKVAGIDERGLFKVYAMKNESTGYMTEVFQAGGMATGCSIAFMVIWCAICLGMTVFLVFLFFPLAIFPLAMGGFGVWILSKSIRSNQQAQQLSRQAHTMLVRS
jgi:hypothetical protein